ncbi:MAG: serine hydrolase domain-containing protein [Prolixibacteraceae bacterium]|jgi:CubicO group peptidase (beta-lactamase class C family)|nr:serine hydrolase domain-containing protein [Prolixibacteraceae bacterium]
MKKYLWIILSFSFLWTNISCEKQSSGKYKVIRSSKYKKLIIESRKEIGFQMFSSDIQGLALAVYHHNELVWSEGMGYANKELNVPVRPDTKFRIGGVSKLFTGTLLAQMVADGEFDLKTPVRQYYPELPADKDSITFYHLASHSSGLRPPSFNESTNQGYQTMRKGISVFIEDSLLFQPGSYFYETDYGYDLIGAAIERKTGKFFHQVLKEKLVDTLKLETTEADHPIAVIENRSQCYERNLIAKTVRATTVDNRHRAASIGLLSSAVDMAALMNEFLHPTLLKEEVVKKIINPMTLTNGIQLDSGLGLYVGKDNRGHELYMASGSTKGGSAAVIAYPKMDLVVAVVCNQGDENENLLVFKIAGKFIELTEPPHTENEKEQQNKPTQ